MNGQLGIWTTYCYTLTDMKYKLLAASLDLALHLQEKLVLENLVSVFYTMGSLMIYCHDGL